MSSPDELQTITDALTEYFGLVAANIATPTAPLPFFEDYTDSIVYDDLLTDAFTGVSRGANYAIGAIVDTVHLAFAIEREFGMRTKLRAQYFADAQEDLDKLADYLNFMQGSYTNYIRGTSVEQYKE